MTEDVIVGPEEIEPTPVLTSAPLTTAGTPDDAPAEPPPAPSVDPPSVPDDATGGSGRTPSIATLRRERRDLFDQREEALYHVGGLAIDLRRRGVSDTELVNRRADLVLEMDQKIADLDQQLVDLNVRRKQKAPVTAGYCMSCGAPFQQEAAFCFRCGARVLPPDPPEVEEPAEDTPTTVIDVAEETR